jgi:hypothetical protein
MVRVGQIEANVHSIDSYLDQLAEVLFQHLV